MDEVRKADRIAKWIARAGICSRRDAERLIAEGRVSVDGAIIESPALALEDPARIAVDGKTLPPIEHTRLWRYHKPAGCVTTARDPQGRPTVFEKLPPEMPRVVSVGRLDLNSEGLLLLTNDGELSRRLELPANGWRRVYRVRAHGTIDEARLAALKDGIVVDGVRYGAIEASVDSQAGTNAWLTITLTEGKNREIRRVLEHLGLRVNRLIRLQYGPFALGNLARGAVVEVAGPDMRKAAGLIPKDKTGWAKAKPKPRKRPRSTIERTGKDESTGGSKSESKGDSRKSESKGDSRKSETKGQNSGQNKGQSKGRRNADRGGTP